MIGRLGDLSSGPAQTFIVWACPDINRRGSGCLSPRHLLSSPQSLLQGLCDGNKLKLILFDIGDTCRVPSRETLRRRDSWLRETTKLESIQPGELNMHYSTIASFRSLRHPENDFGGIGMVLLTKVAFPAESPSGTLRRRGALRNS